MSGRRAKAERRLNTGTVTGTAGCWHCEQPYSPELAGQPCRPAPG